MKLAPPNTAGINDLTVDLHKVPAGHVEASLFRMGHIQIMHQIPCDNVVQAGHGSKTILKQYTCGGSWFGDYAGIMSTKSVIPSQIGGHKC